MSRTSKWILLCQTLLTLGTFLLILATDSVTLFRGERIVGIALLIIGAAMLISALVAYRQVIGTFKVKPAPEPAEKGELITRGIYSIIRHPFYSATPLILTGTALALRKPWGLVLIPGIIVFLYFKSCYEESLLEARFPAYRDYRSKTGRFLPRM